MPPRESTKPPRNAETIHPQDDPWAQSSPASPAPPPLPAPPGLPAPPTMSSGGGGVRVIVRDVPPPPLPPAPPPPPEQFPRVRVMPKNQPLDERNAFIKSLYEEHGEFILATLQHQHGVKPRSVRDLQQEVVLVYSRQVDRRAAEGAKPIENPRGYLKEIARKVAGNHRTRLSPKAAPGAEPDMEVCPRSDPERAAARAERWAKLSRYLPALSPEEREVIEATALLGLTLAETALKVGRHEGTVTSQLFSGRRKLREIEKESERATDCGERRKPGK